MKIINRLSALAVALLTLASTATAQVNSPYSKFGYGLLNDNATATQRQMGGIGYGMNSGRQINVMNPASYAMCDTLTFLFDMGVSFTTVKQSEASSGDLGYAKSTEYGGGLDYITMQVPIGRYMGASIGIVPFTSVGYAFGTEIANGTNSRQGSGGLNQLYLGYAGRLFKGFSIGANVSYLFGTTVNDVFVNTDAGSSSLFEQVVQVRDWRVQFGAQYTLNLNANNRLTAGLVYTPGKTLLGKAWVTKYDVNADEAPDTLETGSLKNRASLPETWGAGLTYRWGNRLMVGVDYTYQPWSKVKTLEMKDFEGTRFADRWQVALGGEYTHAQRGNYLARTTYRAGAFYNRDYMMVGNNHVREYGISFGFGLPALSSKTVINLGFEYRHRQATPNPLLKESYFNIRLGINFNELWFFQNKIK
ncbi:MAG: outer membrane protein transport protein [Bacteroides sp.]|nr:outer membrane protein transport protein [Bacteroides sp.]MCM1413020.1 outer membrane protein transport protein [Bacteroides sp.]MCM1471726.1 outer membrane protein transport protein [Bacteroides sp.]